MDDPDLETLLQTMRLGDKLQWLARLSPTDIAAIELIANACLRRHWPRTTHDWLQADLFPRPHPHG